MNEPVVECATCGRTIVYVRAEGMWKHIIQLPHPATPKPRQMTKWRQWRNEAMA